MTVNSVTEKVTYCPADTILPACQLPGIGLVNNANTIMQALVNAFNADPNSPVTAQLTSSGVTVTPKNSIGFPIISSADSNVVLGGLGGIGFLGIPVVPTPNALSLAIIGSITAAMTGPSPFSVSVNGVTETVNYCECTQPGVSGFIDSPSTLAAALVKAFNSGSASPVTASTTTDVTGAVLLTLTAKTSGTVLTVLSSDGGAAQLGGLGGINFLAIPIVPALNTAALNIFGSITGSQTSPMPFSVSVNGFTKTVNYCECTQSGVTGFLDSANDIEQALANAFNADTASPVTAAVGTNGLQLTAITLGTVLTVTSSDGGAQAGGLSGINFVGINGSLPGGVGPVPGFINPKFMVVGVTYAPPGMASTFDYTNSTVFGTKMEIDHTFKNTVTLSIEKTGKIAIKGFKVVSGSVTVTATDSTTWTWGSSDGKSIDIEKTTTRSNTQPGPADSFIGLDHDFDIVWVWLNPVLPLSVDPNNDCTISCVVLSDGVGFDPADQPDLDVVPIPVGILNGDIPLSSNPGLASVLQRAWASGQAFSSGDGPALTGPGPGTDFDTIARFDPFWQCDPSPANCPTSVDLTRFSQADTAVVNYQQAQLGGQPIPEGITLDVKNTNVSSSGTDFEFSHKFALKEEFDGSIFGIGLKATLMQSDETATTTTTKTDITNSNESTAAATIVGPTCTVPPGENFCQPEYTGPVEFTAYVDDKFGTFMLFPAKDPRFRLGVKPASQPAPVGSTVTYAVTSTAVDGFTRDVALTLAGVPANQGITATFNPATITGANGTSTLTISTISTTSPVTSNLVVTGTSGTIVDHVPIALQVENFTVSVTPPSETVTAGNNTAFDVTITPENGKDLSALSLTVNGLPTGVQGTFSTPTANGSGGLSSTLTIATTTSAAGGNFQLTVCGTVPGLPVCAAPVNLTVTAPDFTISATPGSQTVSPGQTTTYTVSTTAANGFNGSVALSLTGLPAGATATFNPTSIAGAGSSTLTVTTSASTPAGTSTLQINGASGSLNHSTAVNLVVNATPDFTIAISPQSAGVAAGASTTYTVTTTAINGFTGNVSLTIAGLPAGATGTFSPNPIAGAGTSTLTVQTSSTTPVASSNLTITGTSGSLNHSTQATLTVDPPPPDFSLSATPSSQTTACGCVAYTVSVTQLNGFSGNVSFSLSGLPAGATATFSPTTVTGSGSVTLSVCTTSTTPAGNYTLTLTATSGSLTHSITLVLVVTDFSLSGTPSSQTVSAGSSTTYGLTVSPTNGFSDAVSLSLSGLPAGATGSFNPTSITGSGTSTLSVATSATTPTGNYTLTITATDGCRSHSATVTLMVNPPPPPPPTISGLSVSSGPVGTPVTISGASFGSTGTVTFNGVAATVSSWGSGTLVTSVPIGATTGPVVVTVGSAGSNSLTFTVTTPTPFFMTTASSSTSGLDQLATAVGSVGHFPSSDLVNQPAGDYLIEAFDTQAGTPGVAYTWTSGVNASFVVWMQQTAGTTGTLFPEVKLFLNSPSGTPICSVVGTTALTTTNTQYNLSCAPGANVTLANTDRYYLWVGVSSTASSSSSLKSQFNVGSQARGRPVSSVTCPD